MTPTIFKIPADVRERVRQAIRKATTEASEVTLRAITEGAKVRRTSAALLLRALRDGYLDLSVAWDGTLTSEDLSRRIQEATTDTLRAQLCNDLARALHLGLIEPVVGRAMGALIAEARQCDRSARESAEDTSESEPVYLLSHAAITVGRGLDFLVSPELRAEVIAFVEDAARRDLELFPNPTTAEIEALRAEGASRDL